VRVSREASNQLQSQAWDTAPILLYSLLYNLVRVLIEILIVGGRGDGQLRAEVLALRHQLGVLERQVGRPRWQPTDRLLLAAVSRALTRRAWRSLLPSPETLLRWHRGAAQEVAVPAGASPAGVIPSAAP
jgi:hypothetical protein